MRSQATKPLPKKGALNKTAIKAGSAGKQAKRKSVSPKKVKNLLDKTLVKNSKKNSNKDDYANKKDDDTSTGDKNETSSESIKSGPSKNSSRSNSPTKKPKKDTKEKKDAAKSPSAIATKKIGPKKILKSPKKSKVAAKKTDTDSDDIKYKINVDAAKKTTSKFSKAKTIIKKTNSNLNKKGNIQKKHIQETAEVSEKTENKNDNDNKEKSVENKIEQIEADRKEETKLDDKPVSNKAENTAPPKDNSSNPPLLTQPETPKSEIERPPKFFTSTRSPRTVDIDVKLKITKGNLSMSERFLSMKCETKSVESDKDKINSNNLVSQGPEIDVYTFTEKVDSPKSILSDFRNPINKNIGRVRPIARVKGTVIDRKGEAEKKKYSPHRPIEEVVKQLKASKRSEDFLKNNQDDESNSNNSNNDSSTVASDKEVEDKPKPIVSKSYKMVARKSNVTGKPFSPIKFPDQDISKSDKGNITSGSTKKNSSKAKKQNKKSSLSDEELESSKFSLNTKTFHYSSSEESISESNDDNDTKESSESDTPKSKKTKNKKYKRITDSMKKKTSKELKELSKDSLVDLKDELKILGSDKPSKRRLKLLSMWSGPKKHRMASLNAMAKVHCLYENESRTHMELGLMKTIDRQPIPSTSKSQTSTKVKESKSKETEKEDTTSESEYENKKDKKDDSSESSDDNPPQRSLRGVPGIRSAGKYWDPKSSTSSSEDSEMEYRKKTTTPEKKKTSNKTQSTKSDSDSKPPAKMKKTAGVPVKKKRNRNEVVMDLKDMVVQKRMASLNATAILAASYEKRSPKSNKEDTTSDSCSDESFSQKSKNGACSGVKSEVKNEDAKKECDDTLTDRKQKVEVIVNQDTDVTITGVYSTHHHEGFCTVSGMQYRISSTSHTQTTATANCEKEGCSRDEARYTPLSALSSMKPPADHAHGHPHPVPELGGLARRAAGCSSAFSAPSPSAHHDPGKPTETCSVCDEAARLSIYGYYQPAGPLIKETAPEAERALARYHPPPHYHAPHPPVLPQYGPYYPPDLCYGRYYRPPGPYHMPPQPDAQMVGVGGEPYPPPQYYGTPPCYQHSPQRIPYEYRGCPCPLNTFPKNVLIGPATGKAPTGSGPADVPSALAPPGGAFRAKVRACALDAAADNHGSGKDPPLEPEPPAAADAPHPCPLPAIGGASPKRELYDVRENLRVKGDLPGPTEAIGPPSPARGSAGACAPQPPPVAVPRRARLGKAMARRSLAGDDTGLLLSVPQPLPTHHSDADDDVLAISPPTCAPIDLSSSDERSTPLVDVKKENEGPTCATTSRKTDTLALREHNSTTTVTENSTENNTDAAKPAKRRYSKPKLEIDMKDTQLEESCKTNGIGEHVKLQKRRKVSSDQANLPRPETNAKEIKKKSPQIKKSPKTLSTTKRALKRKLESAESAPKVKRIIIDSSINEEKGLKGLVAQAEDTTACKPKTKSALLLDNLIRKNSIDRPDPKEINPAELFLPSGENTSQNTTKKTLNINNNIVVSSAPVSGVRPNTIAAVSQLIEKKLAYKNACKLEKIDSKITHNSKSVLKSPTDNTKLNEDPAIVSAKCKSISDKNSANVFAVSDTKSIPMIKDSEMKDNVDLFRVSDKSCAVAEGAIKSFKVSKTPKAKAGVKNESKEPADESHSTLSKSLENLVPELKEKLDSNVPENKIKRCRVNKRTKSRKSIEKVAKLLGSMKPTAKTDENIADSDEACIRDVVDILVQKTAEKDSADQIIKSCNANIDVKTKSIERVAKLLVSKKPATNDSETEPVITEDKESQRTSLNEVISERLVPEKTLPKRCKLTNGEIKAKNVEKVVKLLVSKKPALKTDEASLVIEDACASPLPTVGRRARRRRSGTGLRRVRRPLAPLALPTLEPRAPPRWSNGWQWDGEHYISKVYLNNDSRLDRTARCWSRMTHASGDSVGRGDCVLLRASTAKAQPFVARIASLWENSDDGEMMVSLVWYYRPEHTERGREPADAPDEVFASRHRDANSVACIEDKCYVLTFNEYCRYRKRLKAQEEGVTITPSIVPPLPPTEITPAVAPNDSKLPPGVSPELVLFCRKIYDFRSKKIQVPNK